MGGTFSGNEAGVAGDLYGGRIKNALCTAQVVTVPNVMGMTEEAALKLLNSGVWLPGRAIRIIAISEVAESR